MSENRLEITHHPKRTGNSDEVGPEVRTALTGPDFVCCSSAPESWNVSHSALVIKIRADIATDAADIHSSEDTDSL